MEYPLIRYLYRNHLDFSQILNNFPHTKSANPAFIHSFPGILCVNLAFNPKSWTHKPDLPGQAYLATEFAPAKRQRGGCRVRLMTFDGFRFGFRKDRRRPEPGSVLYLLAKALKVTGRYSCGHQVQEHGKRFPWLVPGKFWCSTGRPNVPSVAKIQCIVRLWHVSFFSERMFWVRKDGCGRR